MLLKDFGQTKFLERGIGYLGPGQDLVSGFTRFPDGYEEKIKTVLCIEVTYRDAASAVLSEAYRLDFAEIEGTTRLGTPPLHAIAKALESIQGDVHQIASGFKRLKIDVYDSQDRADETARIRERIEEEMAGSKAEDQVRRSDT